MAICPKDLKPCIDDLCYAGDCLRMAGVQPLMRCPGGCGALIFLDGSDPEYECTCHDEDDWYEDDEPTDLAGNVR